MPSSLSLSLSSSSSTSSRAILIFRVVFVTSAIFVATHSIHSATRLDPRLDGRDDKSFGFGPILEIRSANTHIENTTTNESLRLDPAWNGHRSRNTSVEILKQNTSNPSQYCQTSHCWKSLATSLGLVRVFQDRHDQAWLVRGKSSDPLRDPTDPNRTYAQAGILYVKNFKAASSTAAGVALRLAHRLPGNTTQEKGWVRFHHTPGSSYRSRNPQRSFLFTSVRDPAKRALSRIFYTYISQYGYDPYDDRMVLHYLESTDSQYGSVRHVGGGYQVWYTSLNGDQLPRSWGAKRPTTVQHPSAIHDAIQRILQDYDFIMVAERLDESVVVMALLMNVSLDDVIVQNAKDSSANSWYFFKQRNSDYCRRPAKVVQTPAVREHLQSEQWLAKNYGDYLLHAAADLSLDATIARLGRDRVSRALQAYRALQNQVVAACHNQTIYHCSPEGVAQRPLSRKNCYSDDSGCGYPCIDDFLTTLPVPKESRIF